jgi:hypothetical protein
MGAADPARPFDPDWCPSIQIGESLSTTIGDDGRRPDHSKKHLSRPGTGAFFLLFSVEIVQWRLITAKRPCARRKLPR